MALVITAVALVVVLGHGGSKTPAAAIVPSGPSASGSAGPTGSTNSASAPPIEDGVVVGRSTKVTIDVYEDYMCPYCRQFEESSGTALEGFASGGTARVRYHMIAILDRMSSTNYSTRAASAAYCANDAGVFSAFHKLLMVNQPAEGSAGITDEQLIELGKTAGATGADFAQCVSSQRYVAYVAQATQHAISGGLEGTPTVAVNGQRLTSPSLSSLQTAVHQAGGS